MPSLLSLVTLLLVAAAAPANQTQVVYYHPTHMTVTKTVKGSCWTGSIAANRADAFRCMVGNEISDPCFVRDSKSVACPDLPKADSGIVIALTAPLPENKVSGAEDPWAMVVVTGGQCRMGTGTVMPGFPYYCTGVAVCAVPTSGPSGQFFSECGTSEASSSGPRVVSRKRYPVTTIWR
jgi:hypothetical protein